MRFQRSIVTAVAAATLATGGAVAPAADASTHHHHTRTTHVRIAARHLAHGRVELAAVAYYGSRSHPHLAPAKLPITFEAYYHHRWVHLYRTHTDRYGIAGVSGKPKHTFTYRAVTSAKTIKHVHYKKATSNKVRI